MRGQQGGGAKPPMPRPPMPKGRPIQGGGRSMQGLEGLEM